MFVSVWVSICTEHHVNIGSSDTVSSKPRMPGACKITMTGYLVLTTMGLCEPLSVTLGTLLDTRFSTLRVEPTNWFRRITSNNVSTATRSESTGSKYPGNYDNGNGTEKHAINS